jgi:hypothetical protein
VVEKGKINLKFCETTESGLLTANFKVKVDHALSSQEMKEDIMTFHKKLGHPCKDLTKKTGVFQFLTYVAHKALSCALTKIYSSKA